jgi:hypothetical protein
VEAGTDQNSSRNPLARRRKQRDRADSSGGPKEHVQATAAAHFGRETQAPKPSPIRGQKWINPAISLGMDDGGANTNSGPLVRSSQQRTSRRRLCPSRGTSTASDCAAAGQRSALPHAGLDAIRKPSDLKRRRTEQTF